MLTTLLLWPLGGDPLEQGLAQVREALLRRPEERNVGEDALTRRLAGLGAPAAPALLALVEGSGLDLLLVEGETPTLLLCPPERVGELALRALARLPDEAVHAALRELLAARPGPETRAAALRVLGARDSARSIALVFELLRDSELELGSPTLRAHARQAIRAPLGRDPLAYMRLAEALPAAPPHTLVLVAEALAECATEDAVEALESLLGRDAALDLVVIDALARAGTLRPWRVAGDVAGALEALLGKGTSARRAATVHALGRLARPDSVQRLVPLLQVESAEVRGATLSALAACAGRARFQDAEECQAWLTREQVWWKGSGEARVAALAAGELAPGEALRELYTHPLARAATAEALLADLDHDEPGRRALAAGALGRLGVAEHVPDLVPLLDDADASVRTAALKALRALTGVELPPERSLWDAYAFD